MPEGPITFYWTGMSSFESDGALLMRATGYDDDSHWTGQHRVAADDPDLELWRALRDLMRALPQAPSFVSSEQLPALREQFRLHHRIDLPRRV